MSFNFDPNRPSTYGTAKEKSFESWIWDAACSIRAAKDAPKYKDYILPLIFTKRFCDAFDDWVNTFVAKIDDLITHRDRLRASLQTGQATQVRQGDSLVEQAVGLG